MNCNDFDAMTKRHPETVTGAEIQSLKSHVSKCGRCSSVVRIWLARARTKPPDIQDAMQQYADYRGAKIASDPELTKPIKITSIRIIPDGAGE